MRLYSVYYISVGSSTIRNYNFADYFLWVCNLVADIEGTEEAEGVWEHGVEENIWT